MSKQRFFIELAYDGTNYHGWQMQPNAIGVQEVLYKALSTVLRQPIETLGCGRTDTGVHAKEFFAHFDFESIDHGPWTMDTYIRGFNSLLPHDIAIKKIIPVAADAHARFDATLRSYEYHIHFNKDPFKNGYSWLLRDEPDLDLMNQAAKLIIQYIDFSCFSKSNTQTFTNNCVIKRAEWIEVEGALVFHISADRFLRNMVRAIVGTLVLVGRKEIDQSRFLEIIARKDRCSAGQSVPACGLYLVKIVYPFVN